MRGKPIISCQGLLRAGVAGIFQEPVQYSWHKVAGRLARRPSVPDSRMIVLVFGAFEYSAYQLECSALVIGFPHNVFQNSPEIWLLGGKFQLTH